LALENLATHSGAPSVHYSIASNIYAPIMPHQQRHCMPFFTTIGNAWTLRSSPITFVPLSLHRALPMASLQPTFQCALSDLLVPWPSSVQKSAHMSFAFWAGGAPTKCSATYMSKPFPLLHHLLPKCCIMGTSP
jgi:hypothetical protein